MVPVKVGFSYLRFRRINDKLVHICMLPRFPVFKNSDNSLNMPGIGFNPKMKLYMQSFCPIIMFNTDVPISKESLLHDWTEQLGPNYISTLEDNFWFCISQSKCNRICKTDCPDNTGKFIYSPGSRTAKKVILGSGGFATVYAGRVHGMDIASKYIDVTEKYKKITFPIKTIVNGYSAITVMPILLGDVAYEASVQSGFGHPNILPARDYWIQCSDLKKIELVIATKRCYKNLQQWVDTEPFNFELIRGFIIGVSNGLEYLERQELSHRDIKPGNILITDKLNPIAVITDFGLVKKEGLTPLFSAPERFEKQGTVIGKTDTYSFGITILSSFLKSKMAMLTMLGTTKSVPEDVVQILRNNEIIKLVQDMIQYDPAKRPSYPEIRRRLRSVSEFVEQLSLENMNLPEEIPSSAMPSRQVYQMSFDVEPLSIYQNSITVPEEIHQTLISGSIHDQKQSHLCWAFSISTIIAAELRRIIHRLRQNGYISRTVSANAILMANQINKHNRLMFELVCLINPRSPKLEDFFGNRAEQQIASVSTVMEILCYPGILRPPGWHRLPSVRRVIDIIYDENMIDAFTFEHIYYMHPSCQRSKKYDYINRAFCNTVNNEEKPTVALINGCHAVTLVREEDGEYVFKNSYGSNNNENPAWIRIPVDRPPCRQEEDFVYGKFLGLTITAHLNGPPFCQEGIYLQS